MENSYKCFSNKDCKYYPCHDIKGGELNCMFCFCPLYNMGKECGGNFKILENGVKDCSACTLVHGKNGYDYIINKLAR